MLNIKEKLVVALFGYEINLVDRSTRGEVVTVSNRFINSEMQSEIRNIDLHF